MNYAIIFTNNNGGVSVCVPTGELPIEQVQAKDVPPGVPSFIVELTALPMDNYDFFDAWELSGSDVVINIDKARDITKDRLRFERTTLLQQQDVAFQRALEAGTDTSAIVAEKQRLRNITTLADDAATLDQLRAIHCGSN